MQNMPFKSQSATEKVKEISGEIKGGMWIGVWKMTLIPVKMVGRISKILFGFAL